MPNEEARTIVARIILDMPGGRPPWWPNPSSTFTTSPSPRRQGTGTTRKAERRQAEGEAVKGKGGRGRRGRYTTPPPPHLGAGHPASAAGADYSEEQEPEGEDDRAEEDGETPRGAPVEVRCVGGGATPPEENADLLGFTPERAHLLLQRVYGDFPHHNDGSHRTGEYQTTLHGSVTGAGLLPSQQAGTPNPPVQ